jgi:hypothetical protein
VFGGEADGGMDCFFFFFPRRPTAHKREPLVFVI